MTRNICLLIALNTAVPMSLMASTAQCVAQSRITEDSFSIFSEADSQKKRPSKLQQKPKSTPSPNETTVGNCGQGEWAQCDYDGINN